METTKNEIISKANGLTQDFRNKIQSGEKSLEKFSHDAGEKMGSMVSSIADTSESYLKNSRNYIKENPAKGVAIAAAVGMVTGGILSLFLSKKD